MIWTSRAPNIALKYGMRRGAKLHREVLRRQLLEAGIDGRLVTEGAVEVVLAGLHIHHQNHDKQCCCDGNLVLMPQAFNPTGARRDPYTGEFLSKEGWWRRYGSL